MPDFRSYCDAPAPAAETIPLSAEESLHLVAANRARPGAPVVAFDGRGNEWRATLEHAHKRAAVLRIQSARSYAPLAPTLALAVALPKGKTFESIIKKATEIGATALFPILAARVENKIAPEKEGAKNQKWLAAAIEGAKQSGNPFLPKIEPVRTFDSFLATAGSFEMKLLASLLPQTLPFKAAVEQWRQRNGGREPASAICLIGPEGDLTAEETAAAIAAGFQPVTLGPHVLRCETAAVAALSCLCCELRG